MANDFKTEAQLAHEQLALDNKLLREKIRGMEAQVEKLNKCEYRLDYARLPTKLERIKIR